MVARSTAFPRSQVVLMIAAAAVVGGLLLLLASPELAAFVTVAATLAEGTYEGWHASLSARLGSALHAALIVAIIASAAVNLELAAAARIRTDAIADENSRLLHENNAKTEQVQQAVLDSKQMQLLMLEYATGRLTSDQVFAALPTSVVVVRPSPTPARPSPTSVPTSATTATPATTLTPRPSPTPTPTSTIAAAGRPFMIEGIVVSPLSGAVGTAVAITVTVRNTAGFAIPIGPDPLVKRPDDADPTYYFSPAYPALPTIVVGANETRDLPTIRLDLTAAGTYTIYAAAYTDAREFKPQSKSWYQADWDHANDVVAH